MSDRVEIIIESINNQLNPENKEQLIDNLWREWKSESPNERIIIFLIDLFLNQEENDLVRTKSVFYIGIICSDLIALDESYFDNIIQEIIMYIIEKLILEFEKNNDLIYYMLVSLERIGVKAKRCLTLVKGLLSKKLQPKIKIEACNVVEKIQGDKSIKFLLKQLSIRRHINVHRHLFQRITQWFYKNLDWLQIESTIIKLLSHKNKAFRKDAAKLLKDFGRPGFGDKELIKAIDPKEDFYTLSAFIDALASIGMNNIETNDMLNHYLKHGNKIIQESAEKALKRIKTRKVKKIRIGIVTAIEEEKNAVNDLIHACERKSDSDNFFYYFGYPDKKSTDYEIYHYMAGKSINTINETNNLLNYHKPQYVFLIGIAAGITDKDTKYGDIIISNKAHNYQPGDMSGDELVIFEDTLPADPKLLNHLRNFPYTPEEIETTNFLLDFEIQNDLIKLIGLKKNEVYTIEKRKKIAPYFCGELIVENSPEFVKKLKEKDRRGKAIDQESYHVLNCCFLDTNKPQAIVIKAISDYANKPNREVRKKLRYTSARLAAGYLFAYLRSGKLK